jgi:hypothetical protein
MQGKQDALLEGCVDKLSISFCNKKRTLKKDVENGSELSMWCMFNPESTNVFSILNFFHTF